MGTNRTGATNDGADVEALLPSALFEEVPVVSTVGPVGACAKGCGGKDNRGSRCFARRVS